MSTVRYCPACGGTEFSIESTETDGGYEAFVICELCDEFDDTQGPVSERFPTEREAEKDAIRAWTEFAARKPICSRENTGLATPRKRRIPDILEFNWTVAVVLGAVRPENHHAHA
jgi:hypothetical protein